LLKGATDIISNGSTTYLYEKKIPAMTVGGTGDVLSGLVAGLLAKNRNTLESAAAAVFINGLAGKSSSKEIRTTHDFYGSLR
jgi:Predicted sugar kinase